jgi:DNA repair protein RecO (recombination protein O)
MEWTGEGLLIGVRRHGETSLVAEAMVVGRGRCLGLVRAGRSPKLAPALQPGNTVQLTWRARLEDHLGLFTVELIEARAAALIADRKRLYLVQTVCEHLHLLPERDPCDRLLAMALDLIDGVPDGVALVRFELALLDELGFGLDLESCAATGVTTDLAYVSPRSGRAVSREAAEPYKDRLLALPSFLSGLGNASPDDLHAAFNLTGYFLDVHLWSARRTDPPPTREALIALLAGN